MQYGLDNWIWAMQGYNDSRLEVGGQEHRFKQGFLRFKPDGSQLEFLRSTDNNTWGLGISEEGLVFGSTANRNPSTYLPIANRYYERAARLDAVVGAADDCRYVSVRSDHRQGATGRPIRRLHGRRGARALHRAALPAGILEPHGVCLRTDRPPGGHVRALARGERVSLDQPLQSAGQRRRVDRADHGRGGTRRQRLGERLVQLHRATQPHAARLRDRQGAGLRIGAARQAAGADLSRGVRRPARRGRFAAIAGRGHAQGARGGAGERQSLLAAARTAAAGRARRFGRAAGVDHPGGRPGGRCDWTQRRRDSRAVDHARAGALDGLHPEATEAAIAALVHPAAGVRRNAVQVLPADETSLAAIVDAGLLDDADPQRSPGGAVGRGR